MQILATLTKQTKNGGTTTWDFVEKDNGSFAAIKRQPQERAAASKADLRKLCKKYISEYGFTLVKETA